MNTLAQEIRKGNNEIVEVYEIQRRGEQCQRWIDNNDFAMLWISMSAFAIGTLFSLVLVGMLIYLVGRASNPTTRSVFVVYLCTIVGSLVFAFVIGCRGQLHMRQCCGCATTHHLSWCLLVYWLFLMFRILLGAVLSALIYSWNPIGVTLMLLVVEAIITAATLPFVLVLSCLYVKIWTDVCQDIRADVTVEIRIPNHEPVDICYFCGTSKAFRSHNQTFHFRCVEHFIKTAKLAAILGCFKVQEQRSPWLLRCSFADAWIQVTTAAGSSSSQFVGFTHQGQTRIVDCAHDHKVLCSPSNCLFSSCLESNAQVVARSLAKPGFCLYSLQGQEKPCFVAGAGSSRSCPVFIEFSDRILNDHHLVHISRQHGLVRVSIVDLLDTEAGVVCKIIDPRRLKSSWHPTSFDIVRITPEDSLPLALILALPSVSYRLAITDSHSPLRR